MIKINNPSTNIQKIQKDLNSHLVEEKRIRNEFKNESISLYLKEIEKVIKNLEK